MFAGSPDADRLTADALILGQAVGVGTRQLAHLLATRGIYLSFTERRPEAGAYYREAARLAEQAGDNIGLARALLSLADVLTVTDPAAGLEAARAAAEHSRRAGERLRLATATANLVQALLLLGDWDAAAESLTQAIDSEGLAEIELIPCYQGWLAALRGDADTAESTLAALPKLRASEDPSDKALISVVEAFAAAARGQPESALRHARATLAHAGTLGISYDCLRWAWPLAARTAHDLGDTAAVGELLTLLDDCPPGHLAPMLKAERDLAQARLAAHDGDPGAATAFAAAVSGLRELSTPYHLAHGLLDHATHLLRTGDDQAAGAAIGEAVGIAGRLGCQPLGDRAETIQAARPRTAAS